MRGFKSIAPLSLRPAVSFFFLLPLAFGSLVYGFARNKFTHWIFWPIGQSVDLLKLEKMQWPHIFFFFFSVHPIKNEGWVSQRTVESRLWTILNHVNPPSIPQYS